MTTGIYRLEFKSGKVYYGQALDIETRFADHLKSFKCGKASKKLQEEYDKYGEPVLDIVIECHSAYLTYIENYLIYYNYGENCLNTSRPKVAPAAISEVLLTRLIKASPSTIADMLERAENKLDDNIINLNRTKMLLDKALKDRDQETLEADIQGLVAKEREYWQLRLQDVIKEYEKPIKFIDRLKILWTGKLKNRY